MDYNDEWTLMEYNVVDYVIDGYIIVRHKNIDHFLHGENELFAEKIIKRKKQEGMIKLAPPILSLDNLETILTSLTEQYKVIQLSTKSNKATYLGKLSKFEGRKFTIRFLDTDGKWSGSVKFASYEIRLIQFDNDYVNSLKLLQPSRK